MKRLMIALVLLPAALCAMHLGKPLQSKQEAARQKAEAAKREASREKDARFWDEYYKTTAAYKLQQQQQQKK